MSGASTLRIGGATPTAEKSSIGCLAKIEMNVQANAVRVSIRTLHPAATAALLELVKSMVL